MGRDQPRLCQTADLAWRPSDKKCTIEKVEVRMRLHAVLYCFLVDQFD
jgi:hypothetical protein